jgi:UrcA family protein
MTKLATAFAPALVATTALFAVVGIAAAPAPAAAQDQPAAAIGFADLNLATEAGQKALEVRIERTARRICGMDEVRTGTIMQSRAATQCYRQALRNTRERVAQAVRQSQQGG